MRSLALRAAAAAGIALLSGCARDSVAPLASGHPLAPGGRATSAFWTTVGPLATGRAAHTATLLSSGKVLVTGGGSADTRPARPAAGGRPASLPRT